MRIVGFVIPALAVGTEVQTALGTDAFAQCPQIPGTWTSTNQRLDIVRNTVQSDIGLTGCQKRICMMNALLGNADPDVSKQLEVVAPEGLCTVSFNAAEEVLKKDSLAEDKKTPMAKKIKKAMTKSKCYNKARRFWKKFPQSAVHWDRVVLEWTPPDSNKADAYSRCADILCLAQLSQLDEATGAGDIIELPSRPSNDKTKKKLPSKGAQEWLSSKCVGLVTWVDDFVELSKSLRALDLLLKAVESPPPLTVVNNVLNGDDGQQRRNRAAAYAAVRQGRPTDFANVIEEYFESVPTGNQKGKSVLADEKKYALSGDPIPSR